MRNMNRQVGLQLGSVRQGVAKYASCILGYVMWAFVEMPKPYTRTFEPYTLNPLPETINLESQTQNNPKSFCTRFTA